MCLQLKYIYATLPGKKKDPFLYFQIKWHQYCSALLLEEETNHYWVEFCISDKFPVPIRNPVMIELSSFYSM